MGRYLNMEAWYDRLPSGTLRMKRVSAADEARFPREWRELLRDKGPVACVKRLMRERGSTLAGAWEDLKRMVNKG